jgi:uncharacterized repeat protein (TIGR01451 family)
MIGTLRPWAIAIAASAACAVLPGAAAGATPERLVTYVARSCPSYGDVMANLARNNIQESLRDLGRDSLYTRGQPISPAVEEPAHPNCKPIVGWHFRLGEGIAGQVKGPWGALSVVSSPYDTSVVTQASTPLLNDNGDPTGSSLPGAVTVPLTDAQYERSTQNAALWVQGGEVDDPVLDKLFPQQYGFAAVRCAIDDYNGDNVESINYPSGARHVYCYAYYVEPPPTSGTIVVRKVVDDPGATTAQAFTFRGNISYTVDQTFPLSAAHGTPGSHTFFRAETKPSDAPWTVGEIVPPGWSLTDLSCVSDDGASVIVADRVTGQASIRLAAGDVVTCTFTDRAVPPVAGIVLAKQTIGGVGTFDFAVTGPARSSETITTTAARHPVSGRVLQGPAGTYTITETAPPRTPSGHWVREGAVCGDHVFGPRDTVRVTIAAGAGAGCLFTNRFVPAGSIRIRKVTIGATGSARFQIESDHPPIELVQTATTTHQDVPATATGDDSSSLPLGSYDIVERGLAARPDGHWRLVSVVCDGRPVGNAQGRTRVVLTPGDPSRECTFYNELVKGPEPPNPTPQDPDAPAPNAPGTDPSPEAVAAASGPDADLIVTKRAEPRTARPGDPVRYTVTVTNRGPSTAYDVVLTELAAAGLRPLVLGTTQGRCARTRPTRCTLGAIAAGRTVTVTGRARAPAPGVAVNRVAVVTSVDDPNLANDAAAATLAVRSPAASRPPAVTG